MGTNAPVLLETMRVRAGRIPLLELHQRRLTASCTQLGLPGAILLPPDGGPDRALRAEAGAGGIAWSERPVGSLDPVRLIISHTVHEPYRHKSGERARFDRTLGEARSAGADDGILLTPGGFVAETAIWTLLWWEGSQLAGPPLDLGILPAVSRARIEEVVGRVVERRVRPADLAGRSILVANAVRGVIPVLSLEGQPLPGHPDTPHLREAFWP